MERGFSPEQKDDDRRQAFKMNKLVDEGLVSAEDASAMPEAEFAATVESLFDTKFHQMLHHPEEIVKREGGQAVEDIVIKELQKLGLFEVAHSTPEEDQGRQKADIVLHVPGFAKPVYIQLTLATGERAQKKFLKLPPTTIPVIADRFPSNAEIQEHPERLMRVIKRILEQIFQGLRSVPEYEPAFDLLWKQFAHAKAA